MFNDSNCYMYEGGILPPCTSFLGNMDPIIKDGKIIFKNNNRAYYFISTSSIRDSTINATQLPETTSPTTNTPFTSTNFQINLSTFIIGLYIDQIQKNVIKYDENIPIHSDKNASDFIHQLLRSSPQMQVDYIPKLALVISNSNAILPVFTYEVDITPLNFYILFILNRLENNPGLFFFNNSFATEDPINFTLASLNIKFPII